MFYINLYYIYKLCVIVDFIYNIYPSLFVIIITVQAVFPTHFHLFIYIRECIYEWMKNVMHFI